jgi:hypothetical protein
VTFVEYTWSFTYPRKKSEGVKSEILEAMQWACLLQCIFQRRFYLEIFGSHPNVVVLLPD